MRLVRTVWGQCSELGLWVRLAASARGAASFITEAFGAARDAGCSGTLVVRIDSAYYSRAAIWAVRRAGACFSVTAQLNRAVKAAIAAIPPAAWTPISYPQDS